MEFSSYWLRIGGNASDIAEASWGWEESQACYPVDGPAFLKDGEIDAACAAVKFGAEEAGLLKACARLVRADEELSRLAWHIHWRCYVSAEFRPARCWPAMHQLGELCGVFYALIATSAVPLIQAYHARIGIPAETTAETLQQVWIFCNVNYRRGHHGLFGIFVNQMNWLHHYTLSPMFRVGRFEYWIQPSFREVIVYRHRRTRQVMALSLPDVTYDADGFAYRNPEDYHGETFTAVYEEREDRVIGTPFTPYGRAENRRVELSLADWEAVMKPGDVCLSMHIPAGGGMDIEKCRDSLARAREFFAKYFPEMPPKAVVSSSWIFNPELSGILGEEANVVKFQRELFLHPIRSSAVDGLWFIFLRDGQIDLATAPRETRLERQVLDFLGKGGVWRAGGMFLLMDDIDAFGTQPYRK